jgi:diguanylate cyclase (GGDEF)-like protein
MQRDQKHGADPHPSPGRERSGGDPRRRLIPAAPFGLAAILMVVAFVSSDDAVLRAVIYDTVATASVAAILAGIAIHRPVRWAPWLLVALGLSCWVAGDLLWDYAKLVLDINPFPWWSDVAYLIGYPVFAIGFLRLVRSPGRAVGAAAIDTVIVAIGFTLALCVFLILPALTDPEATGLERLVATLYPVGDVLLLTVIARLVASLPNMTATIRLLIVGLVLQVVADTLFAQTYVDLTASGTALETIWICGYISFGAAALLPSMARTPNSAEPGPDVSWTRLALLLAASLFPPAILLVEWAAGLPIDAPLIAVASAAMFSLVVVRIAGLVRVLRVTVADREMLASELRHLALHDRLTGLPNRSAFADRLDHALAQRRRDALVGVIYLDLDNFKLVNDDHGHATGDAFLKIVADRIVGVVRAGDTAARLGGDEFALVVDGVDDAGVIHEIASRLRTAVEQPISLGEVTFLPRASVGLTVGSPGRDSPDQLLREADVAMYAEKRERLATSITSQPGVAWPSGGPGVAARAAS